MSKHTPGPWKVVPREVLEDGSVYPGHIVGGVTEMQICLLESSAIAELKQNDPVWSRVPIGPFVQPNARLIAAAPKMLAELKEILAWHRIESTPLRAQELESIAAVIAQATGEN